MPLPGIGSTPSSHHPWLDEFLRDPVKGFGDLLAGYAKISPYERADPPDAARMLFGPLDPDHPARRALGPAILRWLDARRRDAPPERRPLLLRWVAEICETFAIVVALNVADAAAALRARRLLWGDWVARFCLSPSRDARGEFWRMLALTQPLLWKSGQMSAASELAPIWWDMCRQAGDALPDRYLDIGLLGLRRLDDAPNGAEAPFVAGLAQWALARNPTDEAFKAEWMALKPLYPRAPARWRTLVGRLLATKAFQDREIEAPAWWRVDTDFAPMAREDFRLSGERLRNPGPEACDGVLNRMFEPWTRVEPLIDGLMKSEHRFLSATGDSQFFVRTLHRLGAALIQPTSDAPHARARKAQALAREGIDWEPYDRHLWALWRDALLAGGAPEAAERVGWEAIRRDPDHVNARNQLATLLATALVRPKEAEALLRDTAAAFPTNAVARNQLAELLIALDRVDEAEAAVEAAFAAGAVDGATYALRARLRFHRGKTEDAAAILREGREKFPPNDVLRTYQQTLAAGGPLPLKSGAYYGLSDAPPAPAAGGEPDEPGLADILQYGRLRGLRFRADGTDQALRRAALAEVEAILADEPTFAYARLLAVRHGLPLPNADTMPGFAVAFEQALKDEDKARLDALAESEPRLKALILIARALLGDEQAAATVDALLRAPVPRGEARAVTMLRAGVGHLLKRPGIRTIPDILRTDRKSLLRVVYDSNEAGLGDRLLAA